MLEEIEDTKGVIRIRKSKKNRQHKDQKKMDTLQVFSMWNVTSRYYPMEFCIYGKKTS